MVVNDFKNYSDKELVVIAQTENSDIALKNKAIETLLERYQNQVHKNWSVLLKQLNYSSSIHAEKEEYYSQAKEAIIKAIQKVDLKKIKNDKWKLVGMTDWYLRNVRTKIINGVLKDAKVKPLNYMQEITESESNTADPDVELAYWETVGYKDDPAYVLEREAAEIHCNEVIKECNANWNDIERAIFKGLLNHKSKADIARELNCNISKIYSTVKTMKQDMKERLFA